MITKQRLPGVERMTRSMEHTAEQRGRRSTACYLAQLVEAHLPARTHVKHLARVFVWEVSGERRELVRLTTALQKVMRCSW
jgi:hypothetical protein